MTVGRPVPKYIPNDAVADMRNAAVPPEGAAVLLITRRVPERTGFVDQAAAAPTPCEANTAPVVTAANLERVVVAEAYRRSPIV
jgi:hypothetical protein